MLPLIELNLLMWFLTWHWTIIHTVTHHWYIVDIDLSFCCGCKCFRPKEKRTRLWLEQCDCGIKAEHIVGIHTFNPFANVPFKRILKRQLSLRGSSWILDISLVWYGLVTVYFSHSADFIFNLICRAISQPLLSLQGRDAGTPTPSNAWTKNTFIREIGPILTGWKPSQG